jgi:hypothetical protein
VCLTLFRSFFFFFFFILDEKKNVLIKDVLSFLLIFCVKHCLLIF